jgi:hypothetical protein
MAHCGWMPPNEYVVFPQIGQTGFGGGSGMRTDFSLLMTSTPMKNRPQRLSGSKQKGPTWWSAKWAGEEERSRPIAESACYDRIVNPTRLIVPQTDRRGSRIEKYRDLRVLARRFEGLVHQANAQIEEFSSAFKLRRTTPSFVAIRTDIASTPSSIKPLPFVLFIAWPE